MVSVGGCALGSVAVPVVCPDPVEAGPEPASFRFAARPEVSQGPATAVLTLKMTVAQLARINRFAFICSSFCSPSSYARFGAMTKSQPAWRLRVPGGQANIATVQLRNLAFVFLRPRTTLGGHSCDRPSAEHSRHSLLSALHCQAMLKTVHGLLNRDRARQIHLQCRPRRSASAPNGPTSSGSTIATCRPTSGGPSHGRTTARMLRQARPEIDRRRSPSRSRLEADCSAVSCVWKTVRFRNTCETRD
jgi:hypothetical protein